MNPDIIPPQSSPQPAPEEQQKTKFPSIEQQRIAAAQKPGDTALSKSGAKPSFNLNAVMEVFSSDDTNCRIKNWVAVAMLAVAVFFWVTGALLDFVALEWLVGPVAGITFALWFYILGCGWTNPVAVVTQILEVILEEFPIIAFFPVIPLGILICIVAFRIEDKTGLGVSKLLDPKKLAGSATSLPTEK